MTIYLFVWEYNMQEMIIYSTTVVLNRICWIADNGCSLIWMDGGCFFAHVPVTGHVQISVQVVNFCVFLYHWPFMMEIAVKANLRSGSWILIQFWHSHAGHAWCTWRDHWLLVLSHTGKWKNKRPAVLMNWRSLGTILLLLQLVVAGSLIFRSSWTTGGSNFWGLLTWQYLGLMVLILTVKKGTIFCPGKVHQYYAPMIWFDRWSDSMFSSFIFLENRHSS